MEIFLLLYLFVLAYQDYSTYYISKKLMVSSLFLLCLFHGHIGYSILSSCTFGLPAYIFYRYKKWIGMADVYYLFLFGFILGMERMIICMYVSILLAFIWLFLSKKRLCPFVSFLCVGFIVSYWKGYTLYYMLFRIVKGY